MNGLFSGLLQPLDSPAFYVVTYAMLWLVSFSDLTQIGVTPSPSVQSLSKGLPFSRGPRVSPGSLVTLRGRALGVCDLGLSIRHVV